MKIIILLLLSTALAMTEDWKIFKILLPLSECKNSDYENCKCPDENFEMHCLKIPPLDMEKLICIFNTNFKIFVEAIPECTKLSRRGNDGRSGSGYGNRMSFGGDGSPSDYERESSSSNDDYDNRSDYIRDGNSSSDEDDDNQSYIFSESKEAVESHKNDWYQMY